MTDVVFSLPADILVALDRSVPTERRSQFVAEALRKALEQEDCDLYECALAVEQDEALNDELRDWSVTLHDGIWNTRDKDAHGA